MKRILMILTPLFVIGAGAFSAITMFSNRPKPETKTVETPAPLVRVLRVEPEDIQLTVRAEGTVEPSTAIQLMPEVSGRVIWVNPNFRVGGFFEEGELIGKIDPREYELEVVRSQAAIEQARLKLATELQEAKIARQEWESMSTDTEPMPLVVREPHIAEARASLASAEAALEKAKYDLERTVVKAPFAGRVVSKIADQFVSRGAPMAVIYAIDYAEVRLPILDQDLAYIDLPLAYRGSQEPPKGPSVLLRTKFAGKEYSWQGRIVVTEGQIDQESRMLHAVAEVKDPYGRGGEPGRPPLAVGMFVEAEIRGKIARDVIVLPRVAMKTVDEVLVVDQDNRLKFREVNVLRMDRDHVIIRSGLQAGDLVSVSIVEAAIDGMQVRIAETLKKNEKALKKNTARVSGFGVQVGAFEIVGNAELLLEKMAHLQSDSNPIQIIESRFTDGTRHRVIVGHFVESIKAEDLKRQLENLGVDGFVTEFDVSPSLPRS